MILIAAVLTWLKPAPVALAILLAAAFFALLSLTLLMSRTQPAGAAAQAQASVAAPMPPKPATTAPAEQAQWARAVARWADEAETRLRRAEQQQAQFQPQLQYIRELQYTAFAMDPRRRTPPHRPLLLVLRRPDRLPTL